MFDGGGSRSDEALLETVVPVSEVTSKVGDHLYPVMASLFERFGVTGLSKDRVNAEVERLVSGHFNSVRK
jgi:hypothetical protein